MALIPFPRGRAYDLEMQYQKPFYEGLGTLNYHSTTIVFRLFGPGSAASLLPEGIY